MKRPASLSMFATTLILGLVVSGCSGQLPSGGESSVGSPKQGGTLQISYDPDTTKCVDPFQAQLISNRVIGRNFTDSLTDQDPKTGDIKPWLATSWKISKDNLTYTFNLKKGVTFSDGKPLNAQAVATSFQNDIKTSQDTPTTGSNYIKGLKGAEATDDSTVVFTFSTPNASFLQATSTPTLGILSPETYHLTPAERCAGGTATQKLIGSGPFTLEKYDPSSKTILKKRKGYRDPSPFYKHKGDAYLNEIDITYVSEESVRTGNLISGALNGAWTSGINENDIKQFDAAGVKVSSRSLPGTTLPLFPNVTSGRPLSDELVRRAVALSIDRKTYANTVYRDGYPLPEGLLDRGTADAIALPKLVEYNPSQADKLLDKAGWEKSSDGYRYKNGKKLTLTYIVADQQSAYELLQAQLKERGIDLQIKQDTAAQMVADKTSGNYDYAYSTYTRNDPSALNTLLDARVSPFKEIAQRTRGAALNVKLESLFDQSVAATDSTTRSKVYAELQNTIADNDMVLILAERNQDFAYGKSLKGFAFSAESYGLFYDVWLDK